MSKMKQNLIVDYLAKHGEKVGSEIIIEGMDGKVITGCLLKLVSLKRVVRRKVQHGNRNIWCYKAASMSQVEPEYSYILRNLPRGRDE